jgi:hypothetical protein
LVAAKMAHIHLQITKYKIISAVDEHKSVLWDKINSFIALSSDTCDEGKSGQLNKQRYSIHKVSPTRLN